MSAHRLFSFDVFDTLLTRAVGDPTSLFLLLGRRPAVQRITGCGPEEFARLRVVCERLARTGRPEVTLEDIYTEMAAGLDLSREDVSALAGEELALEERLIRPVPEGRAVLEEVAKSPGTARRLAVSDMYLPGRFVAGLLATHGMDPYLHDVVVSSEAGATKSTGELFLRIMRDEGLRPAEWLHHGDNDMADVRVPRALGMAVRPLRTARLNRYEQIWERYRFETGGFSSLISGASRLTRLSAEHDRALAPIVEVTCGVAAPILTAYVLWVLRSAQRHGIGRLYFLARDGEILWLIARRLAERLGMDMDLRYLYGSRSVYHRTRLAEDPVSSASWAWSAMYRLRPGDILARLGIPDGDVAPTLHRLGLDPVAGAPATDQVVSRIIADPGVGAQVRQAALGLRDRVRGYLRQEGLCDGVPYAVVDTGWAGRIVRSLTDALPPGAPPLRHGYLFGYMDRPDAVVEDGVLRGYLFDEHTRTGFHGDFTDAYGPLETFSVANHGMTVDFAERDGRVEPVLASPTNPTLDEWPWDLYRSLVMRFVDELVLDADVADVGADLRSAVAAVLTEFWSRPTEEESRAWGSYVYEDDILSRSRNRLAVPIRWQDFLGKVSPAYEGRRLWLSGSVMISPRALRPPARAGLWFNEMRRRQPAQGPGVFLPPRWRSRAGLAGRALRARVQR